MRLACCSCTGLIFHHTHLDAQDRCRIEAEALQLEHRLCPDHVPEVYLYDPNKALIAMEYLAPPAQILRHGMVQGNVYPQLASHVAQFLAHTLFHTSLLALDSRTFRWVDALTDTFFIILLTASGACAPSQLYMTLQTRQACGIGNVQSH